MNIIKIKGASPKELIESKLVRVHHAVNRLVDEMKENEKEIKRLQNIEIAYEDAIRILEDSNE